MNFVYKFDIISFREANDIYQGQLGDCWLLSAIASLTVKPSLIENLFLTREFNPRGKYQFRFYDSPTSAFTTVTIDDYIPVDASTEEPVFSAPHGNECWVMLLEKAFAKYMGSYSAIEGGYPLFALHTITGGMVYKFKYEPDKTLQNGSPSSGMWKRLEMKVNRNGQATGTKGTLDIRFCVAATKKKLDSAAMYDLLAKYHR
jgi:hypothetical protein